MCSETYLLGHVFQFWAQMKLEGQQTQYVWHVVSFHLGVPVRNVETQNTQRRRTLELIDQLVKMKATRLLLGGTILLIAFSAVLNALPIRDEGKASLTGDKNEV